MLTGERRTRIERKGRMEPDIVTSEQPYDRQSTDLVEIARMLTLHQAAGGERYTGLNNAPLRGLELTSLSQLGRGVLIGRLEIPGAKWKLNGQETPATRQMTLVRLVLPVEQIDREAPKLIPKLGEPNVTPTPPQANQP